MTYTGAKAWADGFEGKTPIMAEDLDRIETGITAVDKLATETSAKLAEVENRVVEVELRKASQDYVNSTFLKLMDVYDQVSRIVDIKISKLSSVPVGTLLYRVTPQPPEGYLRCNGGEVRQQTYPELFKLLGHTQGSASENHFRLPRIEGRTIVAMGGDFSVVGGTGGSATHTLTEEEMPLHSHSVVDGLSRYANLAQANVAAGGGWEIYSWGTSYNDLVTARASGAGGNQPHNNMPPYIVYPIFIKT